MNMFQRVSGDKWQRTTKVGFTDVQSQHQGIFASGRLLYSNLVVDKTKCLLCNASVNKLSYGVAVLHDLGYTCRHFVLNE